MLFAHEMELDFAGTCSGFIVANKDRHMLPYDRESGFHVSPLLQV